MNRCVLMLLGYCLFTGSSFAQTKQIDSLKARLVAHPQPDTGRVNRLNTLSKAVQNSDPKLHQSTAQEALRLAGRLHYGTGQAQAYLNLSMHAMIANDYKHATGYANQARQLYGRLNDPLGQVNCLNRLAYICTDQGNYPQSIAYIQQARLLAEPLPNPSKKAYINHLLAQNYTMLGDYDKARQYTAIGLRLARTANDLNEQSRGLNIMAIISNKQGRLAEARRYFEQTLPLADKLGNPLDKAVNEGNIAEVSERQGQYADALRYGQRVLAYFQGIDATSYLPWINAVLAKTYLHTGQIDSAIVYGNRSLRGAEAGGLRDVSSEVSQVLAQAYARQGNFAQAYRQHVRYATLKDSLKGEETVRQTTAMQYGFDLEKKQSQIALLTESRKIDQERSRTQRVLLLASLGGVLLLLALALVLVRNNRAKQRVNALLADQKQLMETSLTGQLAIQQQQLLETQLKAQQEELRATQAQLRSQQEKERIARDLHDHVGAQLSIIAASTHAPVTPGGPGIPIGDYAREAMQSLRDTVWAIDQSAVTLGNFRVKLQQYINRQRQQHLDCSYSLDIQAPADLVLTSAQALNLFRQVQEAVHNAFKHAQATQITVNCRMLEGSLTLRVSDNGVGFDPARQPDDQPHYGLRNLQRRADELHGVCAIETAPGRGTCVSITIPLTEGLIQSIT